MTINEHSACDNDTPVELCLTPEEYEKFRQDPHSYLGLDDSEEELDIQIVSDETNLVVGSLTTDVGSPMAASVDQAAADFQNATVAVEISCESHGCSTTAATSETRQNTPSNLTTTPNSSCELDDLEYLDRFTILCGDDHGYFDAVGMSNSTGNADGESSTGKTTPKSPSAPSFVRAPAVSAAVPVAKKVHCAAVRVADMRRHASSSALYQNADTAAPMSTDKQDVSSSKAVPVQTSDMASTSTIHLMLSTGDTDMEDATSCASSSSVAVSVAGVELSTVNAPPTKTSLVATNRTPLERNFSNGSLTTASQKVLCRAILDQCLPNCTLERNMASKIANEYGIRALTVRRWWKRIRASIPEDDADSIDLVFKQRGNPDVKISVSHPVLQRIRAYRSNPVPLASQWTKDGGTSQDIADDAQPKDTLTTHHPTPQRLRRHGRVLTRESREVVCQALLDRCYSNGELPENAASEISAQFQINHTTVRIIWRCILASVAATGNIDLDCWKGKMRWCPDLDLGKARAALQKVLPQKNRSVAPQRNRNAAPQKNLYRTAYRKRKKVCNALLDACLPSGKLKPNALGEVAVLCREDKMNVYKTWKRMLLSVQEIGEVNPYFREGSKYQCPEIMYDKAYSALQTVLARRTKETVTALNDSAMSFAGKKPSNSSETPARTANAGSPEVESSMIVAKKSSVGSTGLARRSNGNLARGSHEIMCNALLDRCRPDGTLEPNAVKELVAQFQVTKVTVYITWRRMLASVVETGIVNPHFKKEGSKISFPDIDYDKAYSALQKVLKQRNRQGVCQVDESTIDAAVTKTKSRLKPSALALPRTTSGVHLAKGSHDVICNAILDRCRPDGTLEKDALEELADQLHVNRNTVYTMWKRILASVVETGTVDPHFTKKGAKAWFPEVNIKEAYSALQTVLAGRQKGAFAMPCTEQEKRYCNAASDSAEETSLDTSTHSESERFSGSCPLPPHGDFFAPIDSAVEFLFRKYGQEHLHDQDAFRADVHVRMTLNHVYFLLGPEECIPLQEGDGEDDAVNLYLCRNFNVHSKNCDLFMIQAEDILQPKRLCSKCATGIERAGHDGVTTGDRAVEEAPDSVSSGQHPKKRQKLGDGSKHHAESHFSEE